MSWLNRAAERQERLVEGLGAAIVEESRAEPKAPSKS